MKPALTLLILGTLASTLQPISVASPTSARIEPGQDETEDEAGQRRHVWAIVLALTRTPPGSDRPLFESWHGEEATYAAPPDAEAGLAPPELRGTRAFARSGPDPAAASPRDAGGQSGDIPVFVHTLYDESAYAHIRAQRLYQRAELDRLRAAGVLDADVPGDRSVPDFPSGSHILKTAWWPVASDRATALPVWDAELNPYRPGGNPYTSWRRVVVVTPPLVAARVANSAIEFAGRRFRHPPRVGLDALYHLRVDAALAARMMRDHSARKATLIALGRELRGGDYLVLVSANLASREPHAWVWATLWWHDRPDVGPFAAGRPDSLDGAWRHYLLQMAFDAERPSAPDGGPHVCFDPWLEGRLPDRGNGGGTASNCVACHRRASYPPVDYLPITRGAADLSHDPAYAPGRLRTDDIWSIAMHVRQ